MKILYIINTSWSWVLQRSQIIALGLEKENECIVLDKFFLMSKIERLNKTKPATIVKVPQLRGGGKMKTIQMINDILMSLYVKKYIKGCDVVWLCLPLFIEALPKSYEGFIIYDCMDDHVAMAKNKNERDRVKRCEDNIIDKANIVFTSSEELLRIKDIGDKGVLVRNGFRKGAVHPPKDTVFKEVYQIGYFGAIESWFDFELLTESTQQNPKIEYHIIGPFKGSNRAEYYDKRITMHGAVPHEELFNYTKDYDALIMPFVVNDIILSVDPVKLYEYISFGKCVISVWYPEIDRFSPYVYFYKDHMDYIKLLQDLADAGFPPKYSADEQITFLNVNSWDMRCEQINDELRKIQI